MIELIANKKKELLLLEEEVDVLHKKIWELKREIHGPGGDPEIIREQNRLRYTHSKNYTD